MIPKVSQSDHKLSMKSRRLRGMRPGIFIVYQKQTKTQQLIIYRSMDEQAMNLTIREQPIFEDESQAKQAMDDMANTLRLVRCIGTRLSLLY